MAKVVKARLECLVGWFSRETIIFMRRVFLWRRKYQSVCGAANIRVKVISPLMVVWVALATKPLAQ
jgi:hypothetical protein